MTADIDSAFWKGFLKEAAGLGIIPKHLPTLPKLLGMDAKALTAGNKATLAGTALGGAGAVYGLSKYIPGKVTELGGKSVDTQHMHPINYAASDYYPDRKGPFDFVNYPELTASGTAANAMELAKARGYKPPITSLGAGLPSPVALEELRRANDPAKYALQDAEKADAITAALQEKAVAEARARAMQEADKARAMQDQKATAGAAVAKPSTDNSALLGGLALAGGVGVGGYALYKHLQNKRKKKEQQAASVAPVQPTEIPPQV